MERLFHDAGRGRRGLARLEQRRAELRARLAQAGDAPPLAQSARTEASPLPDSDRNPGLLRETRKKSGLPANVQAFVSSDGFVILRGRDAGGNLALLRLANPCDLWMHVEGGPGAHVLVRRGQGQEIPRRSLEEAANLALVKSWQRGSARAGVMCAQARHVRPVRGGKPGSVRVDKVECTLDLQLDPDIETRIARL
jgi:predicted ribosome quality control (RQC) complex YloA/Tae2 family protein